MKGFTRAAKLLEFDKVLAVIAAGAATEGAKERIAQLTPSDDIVIVLRTQAETRDAKQMILKKSAPPFGRAKDILPAVERAEKGASLTPRELLDIASLLRSVSAILKYAGKISESGALEQYLTALTENNFLERKISSAIIAEDMIADDASDNLYRIRRDQRKCESAVRDLLASYTSGQKSKYLQENIVTMRGGRYVVPVKAEYRNEVKGLVHDSSASGATLFVEPIAVLEQNNRLRELKVAEEEEIEKILRMLSDETARFSSLLAQDYRALTDLAVIFAKAAYAVSTDSFEPKITSENREYSLIKARHPLLPKDSVVPISVSFGEKEKTLVITGPNTGGKTVTLKTIGLMALMAQSGLQLPCAEGTTVPLFSCVLPDIGDEQSIEQSLSTFSAHMTNIVDIINNCDSRSLTLFDELGAGTDPVEGAALAISILEEIRERGGLCAATTHYSELKIYALESDEVLNASCEFDVESLRPTYRLITGIPGKSNAFAISSRLGIKENIILRAKAFMAEDNKKFEDVIARLEESESRLEKDRVNAERARKEAERILEEARAEAKKVTERASKDAEKVKENAARILQSAKSSSDYVLNEIKRMQDEKDKADAKQRLEETRQQVRQALKNADGKIGAREEEDLEPEQGEVPNRPLVAGDRVIIPLTKQRGVVVEISGKNAVISTGNARTKVSLSSLRLDDTPMEMPKKVKPSATVTTSREAVRNEIDLRGQTGDDAWFMVDRFLDSAVQAGWQAVTLVHGKGTGALRAALWKELKRDKRIASFRIGRYGEGDLGVTICELKK
ncbi:MAG: endonuclease MutS2 [Clostridia bacterium]|nr:endonuclease MutS2 [Clostridia bacterium]